MSTIPEPTWATPARLSAVLHEGRFAGGIAASGQSAGFGGNLFLRDSCRMMRDVMRRYPWLVRELLGILPQFQGVHENPLTNEFPDALSHQLFREVVGGRKLPDERVENTEYWTSKWGVPLQQNAFFGRWFAVYNSSDGPLLYLITLAEFVQAHGTQVLSDQFVHWPTGETRTVADAALRCLTFAERMIDPRGQGHGLYAVPNTNPRQTSPSGVMRDGADAFFRPAGDHGEPIDYSYVAYASNQALFYEALLLAARVIFPTHEQAGRWLKLAEEVRRRTLEHLLWSDGDFLFFYPAIDQDGPVPLQSSDIAEMLNGPFFDGLDHGPDLVRAIVRWLYSPSVMTPVGPRMISLTHAACEDPYYAYQGSGSVWSVADGTIAKGLRRQALFPLGYDLGILRLLGWFNRAQEAVELTYVHRGTNAPAYHPDPLNSPPPGDDVIEVLAAELGQHDQGWGASAALNEYEYAHLGGLEPEAGWRRALCREALVLARDIPPAAAGLRTPFLWVNTREGKRVRTDRLTRLGYAG